jgi:type II secretory pathway pseudopilin PulG
MTRGENKRGVTATIAATTRTRAFTVIEVLVVLCILILLSGLLMPMLSAVQRTGKRTRTEVVLHKVDAALRQFHAEYGVYPYQNAYPNLDAGESFLDVPNHLAYHLGTDISASDQQHVLQDMDSASNAYCEENTASHLLYLASDDSDANHAVLLNRMARQRARLSVLSGNLSLTGARFTSIPAATAINRTSDLVSTASLSAARPGWARDFLEHEIDSHFIDQATGSIRDDYGTPLVYLAQLVPGMNGSCDIIGGEQLSPFDSRRMGLGVQAFSAASDNPVASALISQNRLLLLYSGRIRLSRTDAGDGLPVPVIPPYLESDQDLLHSDMRYYCAPGFESEFELWSAGPDRRFSWMRDDPANRDNLAMLPYSSGLP